jgi:hypothetical protein
MYLLLLLLLLIWLARQLKYEFRCGTPHHNTFHHSPAAGLGHDPAAFAHVLAAAVADLTSNAAI